MMSEFDVIVVGAGNAALVAALSAHELGARVLVLEAAGREERGGNSRFSGGIFRMVHQGLDSLRPLFGSNQRWLRQVTVGPYPRERYLEDWMSTSAGRTRRELAETVIDLSFATALWMREQGVAWELTGDKLIDPEKQAPSVKVALPPGGAVRALGEGVGLMQRLFAAVERAAGIDVWYEAPCAGLLTSGSTVLGVQVRRLDEMQEVRGKVVLASGGFESNPEMRLRYLGPGWDLVKVRGTRFNMGTMLTQGLLAGAQAAGHWGGSHASPLDAGAPATGDLRLTDKLSRYSYPYALLINRRGERFLDEGEDEVWLTYAKTGRAILAEERGVAFQIFDQKTIHLLEPRYRTGTPIVAQTLTELADQLEIPAARLIQTVTTFNAAVAERTHPFDPFSKDGLRAEPAGQAPKSNWAQRIDAPPFVAYPVTCGITFTYGGLKVNTHAQVLDTEGVPMPGLFATGEITGDFFYYNYAAGSGLMRGAVFGRLAGTNAARAAFSQEAAADAVPGAS
jgi:tricarballylate dehydrogenase